MCWVSMSEACCECRHTPRVLHSPAVCCTARSTPEHAAHRPARMLCKNSTDGHKEDDQER